MIPRHASHTLTSLAAGYPVLAVTGPHQYGKVYAGEQAQTRNGVKWIPWPEWQPHV